MLLVSTLVMVSKDGVACMAAELLTSYGNRKQPGRYIASPEKIFQVGDSFVGVVGWCVHMDVLKSVFDSKLALPEFKDERELFEFFRKLHPLLKEEYFLNPKEDDGDPYESSHMTVFFMNRYGLFGSYSMRSIERYTRFAAVGSGSRYALGAMYAAYDTAATAVEIAQIGVNAGIEFDNASEGPITLRQLRLAAPARCDFAAAA